MSLPLPRIAAAALVLLLAGGSVAATPAGSADIADLRRELSERRIDAVEYSHRLTQLAESLMEKNRFAESIELLGEAVARDGENGVALADLALAYLRHGNLEFAEFYLDLAHRTAQQENPPPRVYEVLGDFCFESNRPEDAIEAWEKSWSLGGRSEALQEKIRRARAEWAFSHRQRYFASDRIEIFFDASVGSDQVEAIAGFLDQQERDLEGFFSMTLPMRPIVILYSGHRYFSFVDTPDWVAGFYDGKIRVPLDPEGMNSSALRGLLTHELAHAFIFSASRGRAPSWLQEGLAQYVEGRRITPADAAMAARGTDIHSLDDLDSLIQQRRDRDSARKGYQLCLSLIQYIAEIRGTGALVCFAKDLGSGQRFEAALLDATAGGPAEIVQKWRAFQRF